MTTIDHAAAVRDARDFAELSRLTLRAARQIADAEGATFVVRDGEFCFYVDEDAISPLWKGQRFPITECVSGWAMLTGRVAEIRDVELDERVPVEAYRPTFVRSLVMTPMGEPEPVGALGVYWPRRGRAVDAATLAQLQSLAGAAGEQIAQLGVASAPWAPNFGLGTRR